VITLKREQLDAILADLKDDATLEADTDAVMDAMEGRYIEVLEISNIHIKDNGKKKSENIIAALVTGMVIGRRYQASSEETERLDQLA